MSSLTGQSPRILTRSSSFVEMSGYKIGCFPYMAWTLAVQIYFFCNSAFQFKTTFICVALLSRSDSLIQMKCWPSGMTA